MIDCGPGRLELWREISAETVAVVAEELEKVIFERGPVAEMIMDNGTVFRSDILQTLFKKCTSKGNIKQLTGQGEMEL